MSPRLERAVTDDWLSQVLAHCGVPTQVFREMLKKQIDESQFGRVRFRSILWFTLFRPQYDESYGTIPTSRPFSITSSDNATSSTIALRKLA